MIINLLRKTELLRVVFLLALISLSIPLEAQSETEVSRRIVFEVTSGDRAVWESVIRNVKNLRNAFGENNLEVEVVGHSAGIGMLKSSSMIGAIKRLSSDKIVFSACENTMESKNIEKGELQEVVRTVDSGVAQIVRKQDQGWAYLKADS